MTVTASELVLKMGTGCNIGNTLDTAQNSRDGEVIARRLDALWTRGFRHVRIPVTWQPENTKVSRINDPQFVSLVDAAVKAALKRGFVIILNAHHEAWLKAYDGSDKMSSLFEDQWRKIATRYADRPQDKLIFEIINEPQGTMCAGTPRAQELTRQLNQVGYGAVRSVSRERIVFVQPNNMGDVWAARATYAMPSMLPGGGKDKFLGITVHSYGPPEFALPTGSNSFFDTARDPEAALKTRIKKIIGEIKKTRAALGVPFHLGEFGVGRRDVRERDHPLVHTYYATIAQMARDAGVPPTVWDDGTGNDFEITNFDKMARSITFTYDLAGDVLGISSK